MAGTLAEFNGVLALSARPLERAAARWVMVELTVRVSTAVAIVGSLGDFSYQNGGEGGHVACSIYIYDNGRDHRSIL